MSIKNGKKIVIMKDAHKWEFGLIDEKDLRCVEFKDYYVIYKTLRSLSKNKLIQTLKDIYNGNGPYEVEVLPEDDYVAEDENAELANERILYTRASKYLRACDKKGLIQTKEEFMTRDAGVKPKKTHGQLIDEN